MSAFAKKPFLISIEGNIGAGKTTMIDGLSSYLKRACPQIFNKILFLKEPVDIWESIKDENGQTILENFYKDSKRYAFTFQVMAYISRLTLLKNAIKENPQCEIIFIERSLCADKNIFMNMLHHDGIANIMEFQIYNKWYYEFIQDYRVDAVIYVDSDPDVCRERITRRSRSGEEGIPLAYLEKCRDYHSKWLIHNCCTNSEQLSAYVSTHKISHENYVYPVLHINTNVDTIYDVENIDADCVGNKWLKSIKTFILQEFSSVNSSR